MGSEGARARGIQQEIMKENNVFLMDVITGKILEAKIMENINDVRLFLKVS